MLNDREYKCHCGLEMDRDVNAALNLKKYGEMHDLLVAVSWTETQNACGDHVRPFDGSDPDDKGNADET